MTTLTLTRSVTLPPALAQHLQQKEAETKRQNIRDTHTRIYARLRELGITVFDHFHPLRIGISSDIQALMADAFEPADIASFMRYHCGRIGYLTALARGDARRDLDGAEAGIPSDHDRAYAHGQLMIRMRSISRRPNREALTPAHGDPQ